MPNNPAAALSGVRVGTRHLPPLIAVPQSEVVGCSPVFFLPSDRKLPKERQISRPPRSLLIVAPASAVRAIHENIAPHGFTIGGILESDPFSSSELTLALKVLEPRPQVILVGRGYSEDETSTARQVLINYMADVGIEKGTVVKITSEVFDEVGKEGVPGWVLKQLEGFFRE
ncbi:hypothetical protein NPX13_g3437 [Xylaria arbuscula]|uniref:Uncharacterized protein n=1 Tax=Xylaria arbuscula TaxID=114810 RepID=A0A9W8NI89_9PEZI|nr:hypothetical protein NPX13_g3437 [Xylaria arbuscula]